MNRAVSKVLIAVLLIVIITAVIWFYLPKHNKQKSLPVAAIKVNAATATQQQQTPTISLIGLLEAQKSVMITPTIAGTIRSVEFSPGERVKKGQVLIKLNDDSYQAQLKADQDKLKTLVADYSRYKALAARGIASKQDLDLAYSTMREQDAAIALVKSKTEQMTLYAPFAGNLGSSAVNIGAYVSVGQPLVRLVNTDKLSAKYSVPGEYFPQLEIGQKVNVKSDAYPKRSFQGEVTFVSPIIDADTNTVSIHALVDNEPSSDDPQRMALTSGMYVQINQQIGQPQQVLMIPNSALVPTISGVEVYQIQNNKVVAKTIEIGQHVGDKVIVTKGLKPGDKVVTAGQEKLKEGDQVTIIS